MTPNTRFTAIVGAVIVVLIGILLYQKILRCGEAGGAACCFGRLCNQTVKPPGRDVEGQP